MRTVDEIAREAAREIGEHPIDMGGLISFDAGDRREAQAVIGAIIAAAIYEACKPLVEVASYMTHPNNAPLVNGIRTCKHCYRWRYAGEQSRHYDSCPVLQAREALAALAEPEEDES